MIHPCLQPFHPSSKKATGLPSTMVKAENIRCLQYLLFFLRFDFVNVFLFSKSSTGDIAIKFGRRRGNEFKKETLFACLDHGGRMLTCVRYHSIMPRQQQQRRLLIWLPKVTASLLVLTSMALNGYLFLSFRAASAPSLSLALPVFSSGLSHRASLQEGRLKSSRYDDTVLKTVQDESVALPVWMTEYLTWHAQERAHLNQTNWRQGRYLVVRCLQTDVPCGGLADRLRHVPMAIWIAAQTHRVLFIHWELPAPLQEFLVPPVQHATAGYSLDWRIPDWLLERFGFQSKPLMTGIQHLPSLLNATDTILADMRLQSYKQASVYYNQHVVGGITSNTTTATATTTTTTAIAQPDFDAILRPVWNLLFHPSPAVAALLQQHMEQLHLETGRYAAAHTRALYHTNVTGLALQSTVENAVNCAAQIFAAPSSSSSGGGGGDPADPTPLILMASDSLAAYQLAVHYGRGKVVSPMNLAATTTAVPLHLDRGADYLLSHPIHKSAVAAANHNATAYLSVFVDLYLLANSRCVTFDRGGFGRLGSLLSTNASCFLRHQTNRCHSLFPTLTPSKY
jgi:hypothetical protein